MQGEGPGGSQGLMFLLCLNVSCSCRNWIGSEAQKRDEVKGSQVGSVAKVTWGQIRTTSEAEPTGSLGIRKREFLKGKCSPQLGLHTSKRGSCWGPRRVGLWGHRGQA